MTNKIAAIEEMNMIYQELSGYFAGNDLNEDITLVELMASYRAFCHREPIGGMFLESVIEELMDRALDGQPGWH